MRFLRPDPGNAGADPTDPQTWNAYAYVRNNPLAFVDPSGMDPYNVAGCWFQTTAVTTTAGTYTNTSYETTILGCDFSTGGSYMQLTGSGFQNSTSSGNGGAEVHRRQLSPQKTGPTAYRTRSRAARFSLMVEPSVATSCRSVIPSISRLRLIQYPLPMDLPQAQAHPARSPSLTRFTRGQTLGRCLAPPARIMPFWAMPGTSPTPRSPRT